MVPSSLLNIRSVGVMDLSTNSSVYVNDAPCESASVRNGIVEARTIGAKISESQKR